jgi:hypothetical protein
VARLLRVSCSLGGTICEAVHPTTATFEAAAAGTTASATCAGATKLPFGSTALLTAKSWSGSSGRLRGGPQHLTRFPKLQAARSAKNDNRHKDEEAKGQGNHAECCKKAYSPATKTEEEVQTLYLHKLGPHHCMRGRARSKYRSPMPRVGSG